MSAAKTSVGIISIGDMGLGIAKLLIAHGFSVVTNATGRSEATRKRAQQNSVGLVADDIALCNATDYILSIVPPSEAISIATRIVTATSSPEFQKRVRPLYFIDLNATSPARARHIASLFDASLSSRVIDGGIIGPPPKPKGDGTWTKPSIPLSGPHALHDAPQNGAHLASVLNVRHINDTIGTATGLKMCFASLSKGFTALAIQSFTAASNMGVLTELQSELDAFAPGVRQRAETGLVSMPPKAYRWIDEMREIATTFEEDGGFSQDESPFRGIAEIYNLVANDTPLGAETVDNRLRGQSAEDVAGLMAESTRQREKQIDRGTN
ncbi:hypothetical protein CERZMDRAFT_50078 [Cercospora zeae-maydis SCOH1-5]|uniref:Phosphogluconate dehydrogenase NAD-binding putative C-terminal domain-containing protein n=1 Tax=Cercospora zeae-maydis SCOH1-5 TaxID=717836 RepID=A0A6A6F266_9PEZI|nr:hypothetical protein CERZMDRAFT_50078 [Cercospora zeae-maydis SCOH1-5]